MLAPNHSRNAPGTVRDSIVDFLRTTEVAAVAEIQQAVKTALGIVPASSIRSYLNLNTGDLFERIGRGQYRLRRTDAAAREAEQKQAPPRFTSGRARLYQADCLQWLREQPSKSIQAVVTDPPYGLVEYTEKEQKKLKTGRGGNWRQPPSYDGHQRSALPRFTTLTDADVRLMREFFVDFGRLLARATVPGANIIIASNPLLTHVVAGAMTEAGLEMRGYITRMVMTMRGGDRPKNAHEEFSGVSVMPRSMFEPWIVLRSPLDGRVQDNLRKWGTGGFMRLSEERPFGDVIASGPTHANERKIAPHPSLKPQSFMRQVVRASLPLGKGIVLDPFAGSGSTLAAANAVGYASIGVEKDPDYFRIAQDAIPKLARLSVTDRS